MTNLARGQIMTETSMDERPPPEFRILEVLGDGGSATVYRAVHLASDWTVALKVWKVPAGSLTEEQRQTFLDECRLLREMSERSDRVARFYWSGAPQGQAPWLAMELYETSLAQRLRQGPLPVEQLLQVADDLLEGLAAIHAAGHVHRDVKPAHILMTGDRAVISDLGISVAAGARGGDNAAGTSGFLPPEVLDGAAPSPLGDVYSAARALLDAAPAESSEWLEQLLTRASSFDPNDRPRDAMDFRARLTAAASREGQVLQHALLEPSRLRRTAEFTRQLLRSRTAMAAVLLGTVLAAAAPSLVTGWPPTVTPHLSGAKPLPEQYGCHHYDVPLTFVNDPAKSTGLVVDAVTASGYTASGHISLGIIWHVTGAMPSGQLWVFIQPDGGVAGEGGLKDPGFIYPGWPVSPDAAGCLTLRDKTLYDDDRLLGVPWNLYLVAVSSSATVTVNDIRHKGTGWKAWDELAPGITRIATARLPTQGFTRF
jgi:serine/threonine protein kinase